LGSDTTEQDLVKIFSVFGMISSVSLDSFRIKSVPHHQKNQLTSENKPTVSQQLILEEKKKKD